MYLGENTPFILYELMELLCVPFCRESFTGPEGTIFLRPCRFGDGGSGAAWRPELLIKGGYQEGCSLIFFLGEKQRKTSNKKWKKLTFFFFFIPAFYGALNLRNKKGLWNTNSFQKNHDSLGTIQKWAEQQISVTWASQVSLLNQWFS